MTVSGAAPMVSLVIPVKEGAFFELLQRIERELAGVPHEVIAVYGEDADALEAADALPARPRTLRLVHEGGDSFVMAGARAASGDVVVPLFSLDDAVELVPALAEAVRREHCAIAIARGRSGKGLLGVVELVLGGVGGIGAWNVITGPRAYAASFLERQEVKAGERLAVNLELAARAQLQHEPIGAVEVVGVAAAETGVVDWGTLWPVLRQVLWAPAAVYGLWGVMAVAGLVTTVARHGASVGLVANVGLPAVAVLALTLAVRRVRGRVRLADAFFSLVLLNPLLVARSGLPWDKTLMAAGVLGLMAGAIIAMKRDHLRRYVAVAGLALVLTGITDTFAMLLPALVAWLLYAGFLLARRAGNDRESVRKRLQGYAVMAAAECDLIVFAMICFLAEPEPAPTRATLFPTIVSFAEFPLLVFAILMLALGWRPVKKGAGGAAVGEARGGRTPPYFAGMLALLVGLMTMLLNNFQAGALPPPGADQTALIVCLTYTVTALHGPRRLQWFLPPLLLAGAVGYMAAKW